MIQTEKKHQEHQGHSATLSAKKNHPTFFHELRDVLGPLLCPLAQDRLRVALILSPLCLLRSLVHEDEFPGLKGATGQVQVAQMDEGPFFRGVLSLGGEYEHLRAEKP